ncbi:MAG: SPOR domain-containing protein [Silicimonas sp.]|nr:SPOR domain-containing protein [Silicimonas sp.]
MITAARTAAFSSLILLALPSCEEGQGFPGVQSKPSEATASTEAGAGQTVVKDVERPDIFNVTEEALWDGRPSLGGVWVAHPDVKEPERVIVTNTSNGETVPGALFRRERDNPGPRIQVSSEAAAALSMLAGKPTELSIIVVRQEKVEIEPEPLPISEEGVETGESDNEAGDDGSGDVSAVAAGAVAASEAKPKRGGFWQRFRDGFRKKPAGDVAVEADTSALAATTDDASAPDVETQSLDPVTTTAAAAIAEAEADDKPVPRPKKPASSLKNPYVQVGLFSVEANANSAASNLRQSGIVPTVLQDSSNGEAYWRVVIGPVTTADDQAAVLAQVRQLGYKDAFLTPN